MEKKYICIIRIKGRRTHFFVWRGGGGIMFTRLISPKTKVYKTPHLLPAMEKIELMVIIFILNHFIINILLI